MMSRPFSVLAFGAVLLLAAPASATPAVITPGHLTTAPVTSSVPADVLDLTNWKLTIPVAAAGAHTALEIKQPGLATYASDPVFAVDSASGSVQFQASVDGATTRGSDYPRSELREMTADGTVNAGWSTKSGTHTMTVTEAVTHLPAVKAQVVTAQVHNASDDVVEVVADGTRSNAPGTYSICLRYKGKTRTPCMDTAYLPGLRYTIRIVAAAGHILVFYNDTQKYNFRTSQSGCYFKAGAYVQSNPDKGDRPTDYGRVLISALTVTHM